MIKCKCVCLIIFSQATFKYKQIVWKPKCIKFQNFECA